MQFPESIQTLDPNKPKIPMLQPFILTMNPIKASAFPHLCSFAIDPAILLLAEPVSDRNGFPTNARISNSHFFFSEHAKCI